MAALGLIEGLAEGTANILKIFSGWWSDRIGKRKPFVIGGYGLSAFSKPMLALATGWTFVLGLRLADRTGKGLRTSARDALIADSTPPEQRGRAFGLHRAMDSLGAVIGPLIALYFMSRLGDQPESYRTIFKWAFHPGDPRGGDCSSSSGRSPFSARHRRPTFAWSIFNRDFRIFVLVNLVFAIGNSSDAFLILRAKELFSTTGNAMVTVILAYVRVQPDLLARFLSGRRPSRTGSAPRRVFAFGLPLFALVYAGFAFNHDPRAVWGLFAVYGFYTALHRRRRQGIRLATRAGGVPGDRPRRLPHAERLANMVASVAAASSGSVSDSADLPLRRRHGPAAVALFVALVKRPAVRAA